MYASRAASRRKQGVFAIFSAATDPSVDDRNVYCRPYRGGDLRYVSLSKARAFPIALTASDMKVHAKLRHAAFVRRNFQGTTFSISKEVFEAVVRELERKQPSSSAA
jgi:hypothetical protein